MLLRLLEGWVLAGAYDGFRLLKGRWKTRTLPLLLGACSNRISGYVEEKMVVSMDWRRLVCGVEGSGGGSIIEMQPPALHRDPSKIKKIGKEQKKIFYRRKWKTASYCVR